ncbi:replication initiator protein A [Priestia aryabhattai]|uniref:replication initiator protein A n=1 Tax=Priestia aryabhattai TaxID=412384 RepID=UPI002E250266|nr:replication initiator protein A [Priestia aryabhattai]
MTRYFTESDMDNLIHFQVPKVLVLGEQYRKMKPNALKLYMVLLDRMKLSMQNKWKDEEGRYYVRMSQDGAAELFDWSPTTFRNMKKELEKFGLLHQIQQGQGKSNRLYILKCEYDEKDIYKINKAVDTEMEENEKSAQDIDIKQKNNFCSSAENEQENKKCSSRKTKVVPLEEQLLTPNNNNFNNINSRDKDFVNKENPVHKNSNSKSVDETINKLCSEYMSKGLNKNVCLKIVGETLPKMEYLNNFGGYLRNSLQAALDKVLQLRGEIDRTDKMTEERNMPEHHYDFLHRKDEPFKVQPSLNDDELPY